MDLQHMKNIRVNCKTVKTYEHLSRITFLNTTLKVHTGLLSMNTYLYVYIHTSMNLHDVLSKISTYTRYIEVEDEG